MPLARQAACDLLDAVGPVAARRPAGARPPASPGDDVVDIEVDRQVVAELQQVGEAQARASPSPAAGVRRRQAGELGVRRGQDDDVARASGRDRPPPPVGDAARLGGEEMHQACQRRGRSRRGRGRFSRSPPGGCRGPRRRARRGRNNAGCGRRPLHHQAHRLARDRERSPSAAGCRARSIAGFSLRSQGVRRRPPRRRSTWKLSKSSWSCSCLGSWCEGRAGEIVLGRGAEAQQHRGVDGAVAGPCTTLTARPQLRGQIAPTPPRSAGLVQQVGLVEDHQVGAGELVLEQLLQRAVMVERRHRRRAAPPAPPGRRRSGPRPRRRRRPRR